MRSHPRITRLGLFVRCTALCLSLVACSREPSGAPISGGTLLVTRDGGHAVIADSDRDRILSVDLATEQVVAEIPLLAGDEPGRVIEDGAGRIHVVLRRSGALMTLADARTALFVSRRVVCAEPRGLAWDSATDLIHIACASGELASIPAAGGEVSRRVMLGRDLRDVIVQGDHLVVSRFRTAELLTVDAAGTVMSAVRPPVVNRADFSFDTPELKTTAEPAVAWRTIALPDGSVVMSHQRQMKRPIRPTPGGYGSPESCNRGVVQTAMTLVAPGQAPIALAPFAQGALPVDIAFDPAHQRLAIAVAGAQTVTLVDNTALQSRDDDHCGDQVAARMSWASDLGQPTAVAFTPAGQLLAFYPDRPALAVLAESGSRAIKLSGDSNQDEGRALFHEQTGSGLACASCHPEAGDDGLVWDFGDFVRRTQNVSGGILSRGPYHWQGDMTDLDVLLDDVFANRMSGTVPTSDQKEALGAWLDRIPAPAPPPVTDVAAVDRGRAVFQLAGCTECHSGAMFTNNTRVDVHTGGVFKVPSLLGVGARAPFLHDGCAPTLRDRFGACGGGDYHGRTSELDDTQLDDLLVFLESL
ncbi:MAG: cytochrome-c peroxidase [Kofleriaceae bacterium]